MKKVNWMIGIVLFLCMGINVYAADEPPYMSVEYLRQYIEENDIDIYEFKERSKIQKKMDDSMKKSGEFMLIKENTEFGKQPYYGQADIYDAEYAYLGKMKKNRPDGAGIIIKPVELVMDSKEEGKAYIREYSSYSVYEEEPEDIYYAMVYGGEFKNGRPEGYGVKFSVPGDDVYIEQPIKIDGDGDIQDAIFEWANPRKYEGYFKDGRYSGKGNEYVYMGINWENDGEDGLSEDYSGLYSENDEKNSKAANFFSGQNKDIMIYSGKYKKGKMNGKFKIYQFGYLSYEGDMKKNEQTGKGKCYYPFSKQIMYEGELVNGKCDGKGTMYNEDGSVHYKGEWEMGEYAD